MVVIAGTVIVPMLRPVIVAVVVMPDDQLVRAGGQRISAGPLERILRFEKLGIELGRTAQVEAADIEHLIERDIGILGTMDPGDGVDRLDPRLDGIELGGGDEVGLVEEDDVGEGDLLHGLIVLI